MKGIRLAVIGALLVLSASAWAWEYNALGATSEQEVQLRLGAEFTKKWNNGLRLSVSEELRFGLYDQKSGMTAKGESADSIYAPSFDRSHTTLSLAYAPIKYFKIDGGYTLRLLGNKKWSDPNEFLRHRVFFGVSGIYSTQLVKLSLRERFVCDMRTDSVNLEEKNAYNWFLRSRLGAEFTVPGKPVKPYCWAELENTLNVPEYQRKNGQQFISHVRAQAGVKWRLTKRSSMDFYYRFQYGYDRDINITKAKGYIQLTEEKSYLHALGVVYCFDW